MTVALGGTSANDQRMFDSTRTLHQSSSASHWSLFLFPYTERMQSAKRPMSTQSPIVFASTSGTSTMDGSKFFEPKTTMNTLDSTISANSFPPTPPPKEHEPDKFDAQRATMHAMATHQHALMGELTGDHAPAGGVSMDEAAVHGRHEENA